MALCLGYKVSFHKIWSESIFMCFRLVCYQWTNKAPRVSFREDVFYLGIWTYPSSYHPLFPVQTVSPPASYRKEPQSMHLSPMYLETNQAFWVSSLDIWNDNNQLSFNRSPFYPRPSRWDVLHMRQSSKSIRCFEYYFTVANIFSFQFCHVTSSCSNIFFLLEKNHNLSCKHVGPDV